MPDLKRRAHDVVKRWKEWLPRVALGFFGVAALLYSGPAAWQAVQEIELNVVFAVLVLCAVGSPISILAWSYRIVVLVAVVGMVIGAVAGVFPYLVIAIILVLLELSPEGQATNRDLSELLNNDVFGQLFFVAGAASGGPIAVYVYIEERKKIDAENDSDAENDNGR